MSTTNYTTKIAQAEKLVQLETGKVKLPVRSVSQLFQKKDKDGKVINIEGYRGSYLINFDAIDPRKNHLIMAAFENGELEEADISGMTFTHEILVTDNNPNPVLPCKGDIIEANIAFALDKDGEFYLDQEGNKVMTIKSYQVPVAKELKAGGLFKSKEERVAIPVTTTAAEPAKV